MIPNGIFTSLLLLLLCSTSANGFLFGPSRRSSNPSWDVFIFVQNWPESVCDKWRRQRAGNTCYSYPKDHWTIHGAWPTLLGTRGPNHCDISQKFNLEEVAELQRDLEEWWTPIQVNNRKTYFWEHEWDKHGTCAAPVIETQFQFFKQSLDWIRQYEMGQILSTSHIVPGGDYTYNGLIEAVKRVVQKTPQVICYVGDKQSLLEIRLCFDRSLQLVDCSQFTNCDRNQVVYYPAAS